MVLRARSSRDLASVFRQLVRPDRLEPPARRDEHRGRAAPERLRGSLGDRLERRGAGQRLPEHGRDAVEAALDPCLPRALREHLGVPQRERRETGEGLEDARVPLANAASLAPPDAEHAAHLFAPEHRRGDHVGEALVGRMRNRRCRSRRTCSRSAAGPRGPPRRRAPGHRELEAEQRRGRSRARRRSGRRRVRGRGGSSRRRRRRAAAASWSASRCSTTGRSSSLLSTCAAEAGRLLRELLLVLASAPPRARRRPAAARARRPPPRRASA